MNKRHIAPIVGENITLRLLTSDDLQTTLEWRNKSAIRKWFFFSEKLTFESHFNWFTTYEKKDNDFVFVIEETKDLCCPVGQISLYNIDWENGVAEYGRLMVGEPTAVGKGIATKATTLLLAFAHAVLGLKEIHLEVVATNERAIRVYQRCGFRESDGKRPGSQNALEARIIELMRLLILTRYGSVAGSSRYMSYDFIPYFENAGINCDISPILSNEYLRYSRSHNNSIFNHCLELFRLVCPLG